MRSIHRTALLMLIPLGCSKAPPQLSPVASARACAIGTAAASPADSISVATTLPIDAKHAVQPTNAAERFVAAQAYETLIDVDCDGHPYAGLAKSWSIDASRTRVTLVLRDDARFWNGDPLGARDVVAAWRATGQTSADASQLARRLADGTTVGDDRTLIVSLPDTESFVLAEPTLAVYRAATGSAWPEGSGALRVVESTTGMLTLAPSTPGSTSRITIHSSRSGDARDAVDAGVDLILAADPAAVSYAEARPGLSAVPLPWTRTYALAIPNRGSPGVSAWLAYASDTASGSRAALARDAVRADARAAQPPGWWVSAVACESNAPLGAPRRGEPTTRIVYRSDDHVARGLAERLVALGRRATAVSLGASDFARALSMGNEMAYIIALPRASLTPCRDMTALRASAPWLTASEGAMDLLVPLVDTRERAIVNATRVSAVVDWDGSLRMTVGQPSRTQP